MMFAVYSVLAYLVGLTIPVSTPLIEGTMGSRIKCESVLSQLPFKATIPTLLTTTDRFRQIAGFYFAVFAVAWGIFTICSLWAIRALIWMTRMSEGITTIP